MIANALWVLHCVRKESDHSESWQERSFELNDLALHEDRPYAPHDIDIETVPGSWGLPNPLTGEMDYLARCQPLLIDENNIISVFNFNEGEMGKTLKAMRCFTKRKDLSRSSGSSP